MKDVDNLYFQRKRLEKLDRIAVSLEKISSVITLLYADENEDPDFNLAVRPIGD